MLLIASMGYYWPDMALNLFSELAGAAFTLLVVDVLLVRSKTKRWRAVREHIDYLLARDINRIRDGIASKAFYFNPQVDDDDHEQQQLQEVGEQRSQLLTHMASLDLDELTASLCQTSLFTESSYEHFRDKSEDIWNVLNMKYSEYLPPQLVAYLFELHTHLKDLCGHIRQYAKANQFPHEADYYHATGLKASAVSIKQGLIILNQLAQLGLSQNPRLK